MSDVRSILASELHQLASDLSSQAAGLSEGLEDAAAQCLGLCERLGQVANMIEAPALQDVAVFLMTNIPALLGSGTVSQAPSELCADLELCLLEGMDSHRWRDLAANLADARWPAALDTYAANEIAQNLRPLSVPGEETQLAPPKLDRSALTLVAPPDVGEATLGAFHHEAPLQAQQLSRILAQYGRTSERNLLIQAQRLTHTLKGSSALCGLQAISQLSHALEARLQVVAESDEPADASQLIAAGDLIETLIEVFTDGAKAPDALFDEVLQTIDALYAPHEPAIDAPKQSDATNDSTRLLPKLHAAGAEAAEPAAVESAQPERTLNVAVALIDENLRQAGELNIDIGQLTSQITQSLSSVQRLTQQLERAQAQIYELETLVDTRGVPAGQLLNAFEKAENGTQAFDPLELDEYTQLHSLSRAFSETALDSRELTRELQEQLLTLQNALSQHARLSRDLENSVMSARLVPVASVVPRLERIVRQTARQLDREVRLTIAGSELRIDTDILNGLVEPLMHVLRNAIDHGLESGTARVAAGKPAEGHLHLEFKREGNRIEVRVADDGSGLDYVAIERRAREQNLLAPGRAISERDLAALVFEPGFSTRTTVSAISGRGVGLDAVRASIERMKGRVHLESRSGHGCTMTFVLPLSLTSAHALFVASGDVVYGLPSTSVEQVLYSDAGHVRQLGDRFVFEHNGAVAPLYWLAELLGEPEVARADLIAHPQPLVLVRDDSGLAAVVIDRALDSRQIVIKGLSRLLPAFAGVAGVCVLPDGGVGIVLELRELIRRMQSPLVNRSISLPREPARAPQRRRALVVDDSLSARRTLAQFLEDAGYEVDTAVDGLDALTRMEASAPDVVVVDLEMPRMNGLELTAHLRSQEGWRSLPIVMLTSRATDKHRTQALRVGVNEYFTKPYGEQELLDKLYTLAMP